MLARLAGMARQSRLHGKFSSRLAGLKFFHVIARLIFSVFYRRAEIPANRASTIAYCYSNSLLLFQQWAIANFSRHKAERNLGTSHLSRKLGASSFSSPEPTILLVCAKDRDLWQGPKQEVRESRTSGFCAQPQKFEQ